MARLDLFTNYRSFPSWWELASQTFFSISPGFGEYWDRFGQSAYIAEFVEWVEEQRSKAA